MTFVGFRLILFRVRASGTGMLVAERERSEDVEKYGLLRDITDTSQRSQPKPQSH